MYMPPIDITYSEMKEQVEDGIVRAVQSYGVKVDKEELIRALQYDRGQYEKGFHDGEVSRKSKTWALAMLAGARAIETNRRCAGATYVRDPFGENDGPQGLAYYIAARMLREEGERILDRLKED